LLERATIQDYQTLHLQPGASKAEIRQSYLDLVRVWHPDRFAGNLRLRGIAEEKLIAINQAYTRLRKTPLPLSNTYTSQHHASSSVYSDRSPQVRNNALARLHRMARSLARGRRQFTGRLFFRASHALVAGVITLSLVLFADAVGETFETRYSPVRQALGLPTHRSTLELPAVLDLPRMSRDAVRAVVESVPWTHDNKTNRPSSAVVFEDEQSKRPPSSRTSQSSSRPQERPQSGTLLSGSQDLRGAGTLVVENQIGSDVVVTLVRASNPTRPLQAVYVRNAETAVLSGVGTGVYFATATVHAKSRATNRGSRSEAVPLHLGTFEFLQVVSAQGMQCDEYRIIMRNQKT
jgi:hypothetical protein